MKKLFFATNVLVMSAALCSPTPAQNGNRLTAARRDVGRIKVAQKVTLDCKNPGTRQNVAKLPNITNTTGQSLKKGTKLNWVASDGDRGIVTLQTDLVPNGTISALGTADQGYTCQAWTLQ